MMKLGVIGGSGLYEMAGLEKVRKETVSTPFGEPSDYYVHGVLSGAEIVFLSRHGRGHSKLPSEINHKANIWGFKLLGVDRIVAVSAVGSLREDLRPRDIVFPDQYFDRTKGSLNHTYFGEGIAAHISFADPSCPELRKMAYETACSVIAGNSRYQGLRATDRGTYVNMEGPAFSTKAESNVYRQLGFDVIGMTSLPEAKLSREAGICYVAAAMITDYDCWHESVEPVTVEMIVGNLVANSELAHDIIRDLVGRLPPERACACGDALKHAIITLPAEMPAETRKKLAPIIGKFVK